MKQPKVPFINFTCHTCGKEFRHRKRPDREVKFCSTSCYHFSTKGGTPWNKNKTGLQIAWNKGIPMRESTKKKLSDARKGNPLYIKNGIKNGFKKGQTSPRKGKGKRYVMVKGYRKLLIPDYPRADTKGYVYEHIVVAEKYLNRSLIKDEVVHHINGIKTDNRPENLFIFQCNKEHLLHHGFIRNKKELPKTSNLL